MVFHALPPAACADLVSCLASEYLDGRAHEHDEEDEAQGSDHQNVDDAGRLADRHDVAVAGRRETHGRVVEGVDPGDAADLSPVGVAVTFGVDDHGGDNQGAHRDQDSDDDVA